MTDRGWCPFARQHRGLAAGPFGYPAGAADQNRPVLFVDHRMGGYKRTLDNDVWRHETLTSVHAGIGRDGSLDQYVSIFDAAWGNGIAGAVERYDRGNARLALIEQQGTWIARPSYSPRAHSLDAGGLNVLNCRTISTEHEDETRDQAWTPAMIATSIRWKQWCLEECDRYGVPIVRDVHMLAGHFQIDAVNRASCPGLNWPRALMLEELIGGGPMTDQERREFQALFKYTVESIGSLAGAVFDLAKQVYGDADPKTQDLKQRVDELEAKKP